jgi:hypothetical protein
MIKDIISILWGFFFTITFCRLSVKADEEKEMTPQIFKYGVWVIVSAIIFSMTLRY